MRWPNGDEYKGEWENGKRQGRGEIKHAKKGWIQGIFNNDDLVDASLNVIISRNAKGVQKFNDLLESETILQPELPEEQ